MSALIGRVLDPENLRQAWNEVAENRGMAGVDDVSVRRWRRNWEERLVNLAREVRSNRYRPARLRLRRIPKRKRGEWRTLRIPTVTDRVLQRAAYQVLSRLYEPLFLACSYGYRPGRGLRQAVQRIIDLRNMGRDWVLDADIDAFFDHVDHVTLLGLLRQRVSDSLLLHLIEGWLAVGRVRRSEARGLPMGSPISPLLANVYLHPLDCGLTAAGWPPVRYADDFVVLAVSRSDAQSAYCVAGECLQALLLQYEPEKTRIVSFDEGFDFIGVHFTRTAYIYHWQEKRIEVEGDRVDWLFSLYGPRYE